MHFTSKVESSFYKLSGSPEVNTKTPYIVVENFPLMGLLTALRFLEWVSENPEGVISLPTGKTPEYFIKWTTHLLKNWDADQIREIREQVRPPANSGSHPWRSCTSCRSTSFIPSLHNSTTVSTTT
jgi:hypothetical protein